MKELQEHLRQDEELRWQGKPKAFPLLENGCRNKILRNWILMVVCIGLLLGLYLSANEIPNKGFVGLLAAVAVAILVAPFIEARSVRRQQYFITNQRAILITSDKSFNYMELGEIGEVDVIDDCSSSRCLVLGDAIKKNARKQLRWQTKNPKTDPESANNREHVLGMVFYDAENVDDALFLLKEGAHTAQAETPLRTAAG